MKQNPITRRAFALSSLALAAFAVSPYAAVSAAEQPIPKLDGKPAGTGVVARTEDVLKFRNGDALHGVLVSASADDGIRWKREDAKAMIGFSLGNVGEVLLANATTPRAGDARSVVRLTNGDALAGEIVAVTKDILKLNTWYAGTLQIKRSMIEQSTFNIAPQKAVYAGPTGIEEWTFGKGNPNTWTFKKGALYSSTDNGTAGRNLDNLPDVASIEFDLAWRSQLYFRVSFYTDNLNVIHGSSSYMLLIDGNSIYLNRQAPNRGSKMAGGAYNIGFRGKNKAHIAIKSNKQSKTIAVFVDDNLVKQWTDSDEFAGKGKGIAFFSLGSSYEVRVSNILVSTWDGKLELESGGAKTTDEDLVRLANGDEVSGHLDAITNGQLAFSASFAKLDIPIARVAEITMAGKATEKPRRQANDLRTLFGRLHATEN